MENIIRVTFGETTFFAKVITHDQHSFTIETLYPVLGILFSETSKEDYNNVSFFEERVLNAFKTNLIFQILWVLNNQEIKQNLRQLEFALMIFTADENSPEKNIKIQHILGAEFYKSNFQDFEFTTDMVNYLVKYLDFKRSEVLQHKQVFFGSIEDFLETFKQTTIHSIINPK